jgi:malonate-semialdehyde dehydrogenase (acetylating)/methylmalonate-semialdehyde dehydrogenase
MRDLSQQPSDVPSVKLLIGRTFLDSSSGRWADVLNPATQAILARVPFASRHEVDAAVAAAQEAFPGWRRTPIGARARVFLKYQQLIREHMKELAALLTAEQGKTLLDAEGDVFRGLEVVEQAANIGTLQLASSPTTWPPTSTRIPSLNRWASASASRPSTFRR